MIKKLTVVDVTLNWIYAGLTSASSYYLANSNIVTHSVIATSLAILSAHQYAKSLPKQLTIYRDSHNKPTTAITRYFMYLFLLATSLIPISVYILLLGQRAETKQSTPTMTENILGIMCFAIPFILQQAFIAYYYRNMGDKFQAKATVSKGTIKEVYDTGLNLIENPTVAHSDRKFIQLFRERLERLQKESGIAVELHSAIT